MTRAERRRVKREYEKLVKKARAWKAQVDAGCMYWCPSCDAAFKMLEELFAHQDRTGHSVYDLDTDSGND